MFIRKKPNKSGSVSVQIIDKSKKYKVVETIGSAKDKQEINRLVEQAWEIMESSGGKQPKLFTCKTGESIAVENFIKNLSNAQIQTIGPELILGSLFDRIGFNAIKEKLFRHITIARLAYPTSKLKTVDYLYRYQGIQVEIDTIYRFLDRLHNKYKEIVEKIAYEYTKQTLQNITVVFYDMTTLYFESEDEDDLRKIGFSKDGKFQHPQIMLGLLVGENGYPIGYDIFEGNTFEGHTLIPTLKKIQKKYGFPKPIVIADAGLLSKDNLKQLAKEKYQYILGARIKNESDTIKQKIIERSEGLKNGDSFVLNKKDGTRLVVTYSDKRQSKDFHNREKGLKKLRLKVQSGKLTKENVNNRGHNKFLILSGQLDVAIDETKVEEERKWDGLKGYMTNTKLTPEQIVANYKHLWHIEKAFRISKTDLRIRPMYHFRKRRIEAHILIAFVAYTIWKELERLLVKNKVPFGPKRAIELIHTMYQLQYMPPDSQIPETIVLKMDSQQQFLFSAIHP